MLATAMFLVASPKFAVLILSWLLGAAIVVSLFLYRRRQILNRDKNL
jgi:hypothetical protein